MAAGGDPAFDAEVTLKARLVQSRVLDSVSTNESLYDPRDVLHVQRDLWYCSKFVKHTRGNEVTAYERMVACLQWRKREGINDLTLESLDRSIMESGLTYDHGHTRNGSQIFIINNRLHKRDSTKSAELKKLMIFVLDAHFWLRKDQRVVLFFDMTETGLANADFEMVKFIIPLFRDYFPDTLDYLLVYELPWILYAAWNIVKAWLSEAAVKRIKFATKADVQELIAPDQLLARYGGEDTWEFVFTPELFEQYKREYGISDTAQAMPTGDAMERIGPPELGEDEENPATASLHRKQVRFDDSSNMARSPRQRFSGDSGSVIRRRQVEKILAMQGAGPQRSKSAEPTVFTSDTEGEEGGETEEGDGIHRLLKMSPSREVVFTKLTDNGDRFPRAVIAFTNQHSQPITYKIKTTAPHRYRVKPNVSRIDPGQSMNVHIHLLQAAADGQEHLGPVSQDKFLVQACPMDRDVSELLDFWKSIDKETVLETLLYCRLADGSSKDSALKTPLTNSPSPSAVSMATSASKKTSSSDQLQPKAHPLPPDDAKPRPPQLDDLRVLQLQISNLVEVCQKVEHRMARTQYLMAAILFMLAALLLCLLVSKQ